MPSEKRVREKKSFLFFLKDCKKDEKTHAITHTTHKKERKKNKLPSIIFFPFSPSSLLSLPAFSSAPILLLL
jgi:hypothetical protein